MSAGSTPHDSQLESPEGDEVCPNCHARQRLAPREEKVVDDIIRIYIQCAKCGHRVDADLTTLQIQNLERRLASLRKKKRRLGAGRHRPLERAIMDVEAKLARAAVDVGLLHHIP
jgi:Zn ribbon nucleic-acid-binding protein